MSNAFGVELSRRDRVGLWLLGHTGDVILSKKLRVALIDVFVDGVKAREAAVANSFINPDFFKKPDSDG